MSDERVVRERAATGGQRAACGVLRGAVGEGSRWRVRVETETRDGEERGDDAHR